MPIAVGNVQLTNHAARSMTSIAPPSNEITHALPWNFNYRDKALVAPKRWKVEITFCLCDSIISAHFREDSDRKCWKVTNSCFKLTFTNFKNEPALCKVLYQAAQLLGSEDLWENEIQTCKKNNNRSKRIEIFCKYYNFKLKKLRRMHDTKRSFVCSYNPART